MISFNHANPAKFLSRLVLLAFLPLMMASCGGDDPEPPAGPDNGGGGNNGGGGVKPTMGYIAGKSFTAEPFFISEELWTVDWWVMSFDGNGGSGYDGHFSVIPYYDNKTVVTTEPSFFGVYSLDKSKGRIYVTFDNGATSFWTFEEDPEDEDEWPYYKPSLDITVPSNSSAPFAGLTFHSGNVMEHPEYDEDDI